MRRYADLKAAGVEAIAAFADDVRTGRLPGRTRRATTSTPSVAEALGLYGSAETA